jgi:hypothetical protein
VSDDRPRPEYGEYATPEEQAKAAGLKYVRPEPAQRATMSVTPSAEADTDTAKQEISPRRSADRYITLLFLIFGGISLIESVAGDLDFVSQLHGLATAVGASTIAVPKDAGLAGYWILVANVVLFAATVSLAMLALSRRKISFYIPIVGLFVYYVVYTIIVNSVAQDFVHQLGVHILGQVG